MNVNILNTNITFFQDKYMESILEIVIRLFIYKIEHIWREWTATKKSIKHPVETAKSNNVEILYKSPNFLVINKSHDIVINSNDPKVQVSTCSLRVAASFLYFIFLLGFYGVNIKGKAEKV